jgi:hypothetical protein
MRLDISGLPLARMTCSLSRRISAIRLPSGVLVSPSNSQASRGDRNALEQSRPFFGEQHVQAVTPRGCRWEIEEVKHGEHDGENAAHG